MLAAGLAGCDILGPDGGDATGDLARARQTWEASGVQDYELRLERYCYCGLVGPVVVVVRDGVRVQVVPEDTESEYFSPADFPDVEGLFEVIDDALRRRAHRLTVVYHPTLGYPTDIDIDYQENVADEELRFEAWLNPAVGSGAGD
jgi:hypothetical protein